MKTTRFWVCLITVVLIIACALALWLSWPVNQGTMADIFVEGQCIRTIALDQVQEAEYIAVEGAIGINRIAVEQGRIRVVEADCPDQICVQQGWASDSRLPIVCLPNKVVIQLRDLEDKTEIQIDGVAR